ncbi:MAG: hypothetical protein ACTH3G_09965 [Citricoccus sp.]
MSNHDLLGSLQGPDGSNGFDSLGTPDSPQRRECSRKGCRSGAAWRLEWNNPRIHTPERRKTWLACPEHRDWLADYLRSRGLLKDVLPLDSGPSPDRPAQQGP